MPLPNDFRALGKAPMPPPGQGGSPLQISGNKLQENFEYLDRKEAGSSLPAGEDGDILYHNGTEWVPRANPGPPSTGYVWVLQHDGTVIVWSEYKEITVSICEDGTPTEYTILGMPTPPP
jgi:hypothetical protein